MYVLKTTSVEMLLLHLKMWYNLNCCESAVKLQPTYLKQHV